MKYKTVGFGSSGDDVRKLQQKLKDNGYSVEVDGSYGAATQSAVEDYQKKNGLTVDGVAGKATFGALDKQGGGGKSKPPKKTGYDPTKDKTYQSATQAATKHEGTKPTYDGKYDAQLDELYNQIVNREKFSYDPMEDALYQQQRNLAIQNGQLAMEDTMAQAAGLTGGYGSSYSQQVGQQAYNAYLKSLDEIVPDLYGAALDRYNMEGQQMQDRFGMLGSLRDKDYGAYQDAMNQWWSEQSRLDAEADQAYDRGSSEYWNGLNADFQREQFEYQKEQDELARQERAAARAAKSTGNGDDNDDDDDKKPAGTGIARYDSFKMQLQMYIDKGDKYAALNMINNNIDNATEEQIDEIEKNFMPAIEAIGDKKPNWGMRRG